MNDLTIVRQGSFHKIVPAKTAAKVPGVSTLDADERIPNEARMVTAILPVENAAVEDIEKIVKQFATPNAQIISYGSSLIITENAANLRRIQRLVERLDQAEAANQIYVYEVAPRRRHRGPDQAPGDLRGRAARRGQKHQQRAGATTATTTTSRSTQAEDMSTCKSPRSSPTSAPTSSSS